MQILRAVIVVAALTLSGVAHAQVTPTQAQYEAVMGWAARHQVIIQTAVTPLQAMPEPYSDRSAPARERWVAEARAWATACANAIHLARGQSESLGPVPEAGDISTLYQRQADAMPTLLNALQGFIAEYLETVAAIERNDPQASTLSALSLIDAQVIIQTQFRNLNALQAESMEDGPQRYLLRSFAASYDATIAVLRARRGAFQREDHTQSAASGVHAAAAQMRQSAVIGRQRAQQYELALPAQVEPDQSDWIRRVRLAYRSFDGSFAREERMASILDRVAASLEAGFNESDLDPMLTEFGRLDYERMDDIRRRTEMVQNVQPPT